MPATYTARKPLPPHERRKAKRQQRHGEREDRIEAPRREAHALQEDPCGAPHHDPTQQANHRLHDDLAQRVPPPQPLQVAQVGGHQRGEDDRHRIVEPRLRFERHPHALAQVDTAPAEDGEDGRRIGGRDHDPEQDRLRDGEPDRVRAQRGDGRRAEDPDRCEDPRGPRHPPHGGNRRVESAIEQDEDERRRPQPEGEPIVTEGDPTDAVGTGEHAEGEEERRERNAEA
jgi:hypothetical protein